MDHLEIEVKFFVPTGSALKDRIIGLDATMCQQRIFETNARYDAEDGKLLKNKCLLRLRKDSKVTLTYKSPPAENDARFKIYREREVRVSDFDTMDAILTAIGYRCFQIYEKWREIWQAGDVMLCMDTLPFGRFLEIEGPPGHIRKMADNLGLDWQRRILPSYMEIFDVLKKGEGFGFTDVTFDHFASVSVPVERYLHRFEAGTTGSDSG